MATGSRPLLDVGQLLWSGFCISKCRWKDIAISCPCREAQERDRMTQSPIHPAKEESMADQTRGTIMQSRRAKLKVALHLIKKVHQ